ncbi:hypothetical protein [Pseudomonas sp. FW300-N2F2]|uniref:hypothetical protein n=1 Tax=Pseudomonas sp. FW300-N2F2 TaxID=2751320 RepID=UPI001A91CC64|nr:hypothetical protein [Pseudomonas sp. FW300-N2F2]
MRTLTVSFSANSQGSSDGEPDWVYIYLRPTELMSLHLRQDIIAYALSGSHWVSWEGRDMLLEQSQSLRLSAGKALIDGTGVLQLALAPAPQETIKRLGQWRIAPLLPSRALPLRIEIR